MLLILSYPFINTTAAAANPFQFVTLAPDNIFPLKDESYRNVPQTSEQSVNLSLLYLKRVIQETSLSLDWSGMYLPRIGRCGRRIKASRCHDDLITGTDYDLSQ